MLNGNPAGEAPGEDAKSAQANGPVPMLDEAHKPVDSWLIAIHDHCGHNYRAMLKDPLHAEVLRTATLEQVIKDLTGYCDQPSDPVSRIPPQLTPIEVQAHLERLARTLIEEFHIGEPEQPDGSAQTGETKADEEQQEAPRPLPGGLPAVPSFDERLLPESLRHWLVDIAERAQAPLDYPAAGVIVGLGAVIGRRVGIRPKRHDDGWTVIPNLYGMIVGLPGVLKSPMLHEVLKPSRRLEAGARDGNETARVEHELQEEACKAQRRRLMAQAARVKAGVGREELIAQLRELQTEPLVEQRYIVNDATVEKLGEILNQNPCGVLLFRDEIAGFLATMEREGHENDRAFYLEAWNGTGGYTYDRIGRGTLRIKAACVSILGAITPGPLAAYLRETFKGSRDEGLIQRFQLSVYPDALAGWRNVDRPADAAAEQQAFEVFERLAKLSPSSVGFGSEPQGDEIPYLRFDAGGQNCFDGWRADLESRLRNADEHPVMVAHLAKYRSLMPSLALIFHLSDCVVAGTFGPVNLEPTQRAAAWCDYLEAHARRIYHGVTARADATTRLLGEKIRARKLSTPFTARDVYRPQWAGLTDTADVTGALEALEDLGWLKGETTLPTAIGGRPGRRYRVNPRIWE
jgi:putative DNA primase/helicase